MNQESQTLHLDATLEQENTGMALTAVDTHAHVFVRGLPLAAQRRHAPDYDATFDDYASHLLANGISHAVLVQPSFLGTDNHFLLDVLRRYPQRFRGVAVVDVDIDEAQLDALDRAGIVGIRLNLIGLPIPPLNAPNWQRLLARINALGWHVEVHREAEDLQAVIEPLLQQGCTVVVDHFGRPGVEGAQNPGFMHLLAAAQTGKVWVKLSAAYRSADDNGALMGARLSSLLLDAFSPARLVWGSDWPHTQHQQIVDYDATRRMLDDWIPDPDERNTILTQSARTLYRFK